MDNSISHCELLSQGTRQICLKELIQVISTTRIKKKKKPLCSFNLSQDCASNLNRLDFHLINFYLTLSNLIYEAWLQQKRAPFIPRCLQEATEC